MFLVYYCITKVPWLSLKDSSNLYRVLYKYCSIWKW